MILAAAMNIVTTARAVNDAAKLNVAQVREGDHGLYNFPRNRMHAIVANVANASVSQAEVYDLLKDKVEHA